ncbi:hypothetical protein ACLOJK_029027 [Asimina triloba]
MTTQQARTQRARTEVVGVKVVEATAKVKCTSICQKLLAADEELKKLQGCLQALEKVSNNLDAARFRAKAAEEMTHKLEKLEATGSSFSTMPMRLSTNVRGAMLQEYLDGWSFQTCEALNCSFYLIQV